MKGCNHLWTKCPDGYFCCICGETTKTTPPELIKQTTLGVSDEKPPGGGTM